MKKRAAGYGKVEVTISHIRLAAGDDPIIFYDIKEKVEFIEGKRTVIYEEEEFNEEKLTAIYTMCQILGEELINRPNNVTRELLRERLKNLSTAKELNLLSRDLDVSDIDEVEKDFEGFFCHCEKLLGRMQSYLRSGQVGFFDALMAVGLRAIRKANNQPTAPVNNNSLTTSSAAGPLPAFAANNSAAVVSGGLTEASGSEPAEVAISTAEAVVAVGFDAYASPVFRGLLKFVKGSDQRQASNKPTSAMTDEELEARKAEITALLAQDESDEDEEQTKKAGHHASVPSSSSSGDSAKKYFAGGTTHEQSGVTYMRLRGRKQNGNNTLVQNVSGDSLPLIATFKVG